jgi:hypothetical protein
MRAAHNAGVPSGGNGAAFLPRFVFLVERMHITGKGRTWHQIDLPHESFALAHGAAKLVRSRDALLVRIRPAVI